MRVEFYTNVVGRGWHPNDLERFLGGNEEALVRLAEELTVLGHDVCVYTSLRDGEPAERKGVRYFPRERFIASSLTRDVLICLKDFAPFFNSETTGKRIYWCVDVEHRPWDTSRVDIFVALARYQLSRLPWLRHDDVRMISYGYDLERYAPCAERDENLALYTTSPDRGLERLLLDWSEIKEHRPNLRLIVTYKWPEIQALPPEARMYFNRMKLLLGQQDIELRSLTEQEMLDLFCSAKYWVMPLNNPDSDLIGFSALKAELSGCELVVPGPIGGFQDAVKQFIPYRLWVEGSNLKSVNPLVSVRPCPWSEIARQWDALFNAGKDQYASRKSQLIDRLGASTNRPGDVSVLPQATL